MQQLESNSRMRWPLLVFGMMALFLAGMLISWVGCANRNATQPTPTQIAVIQTPTLAATSTLPAPPTVRGVEAATPTASLSPIVPPPASTATATVAPLTASPTRVPPTATSQPRPTATAPLPTPKPARLNSPEYSIQAFQWWRPEVATRDLGAIKAAGFTWVKQDFPWREIEGAGKGKFDWSRTDRIVQDTNQFGLDLLVRLDRQAYWSRSDNAENGPPTNYQDFADYCFAVASRYKGRIRAYQIWNEPNLAREWGNKPPNAAEFVQLLKIAYAAIKRADPNALVISGGLSPTGTWTEAAMPDDMYLDNMYKAMGGKSAGYFDLLGAHAPGYKAPPEISPEEAARTPLYGSQRFFCFRRVEDLRAIMERYGDGGKQIAILEFGWTSDTIHPAYSWHRVTEEEKADYIVRAFQWAKQHWSPWIGVMSLIYFSNPDWTEQNEEYWWAINTPSYPILQPRPAYERIKNMPK